MNNARNKRQFNYLLKQIKQWKKSKSWDTFSSSYIHSIYSRLKKLGDKIEHLFTPQFAKTIALFLGISAVSLGTTAQTFLPPDSAAFGMIIPQTGFGGLYPSYSPTLADMDNDGDLDLLTGIYSGKVAYNENTGTPFLADFSNVAVDTFNLNISNGISDLTAVDLDGDGDYDLMSSVGMYGDIRYFENIGDSTSPNFASVQTNAFGINPPNDYYSDFSPAFVDIDDDGDLDMLTGSFYGVMYFYENIGTATSPSFSNPVTNPFGLISYGYGWKIEPSFFDLDQDGDQDLIVGKTSGTNSSIQWFENIGSVCAPQFAPVIDLNLPLPPYTGVELRNIAPAFADIDNDGDQDLFLGYVGKGHIYFMEQDASALTIYTDPIENIELCNGGNYTFPDGTIENNITVSNSHLSGFTSVITGCDSSITTNIIIIPDLVTTENIELCEAEDYTYPDGTIETGIITSTSHVSNLSSVITGCDSAVTTNISILPTFSFSENVTLCEGETYIYPDGNWESNITTPTTHISYLNSLVTACDSIITTNISIIQPNNSSESIDLCEGEDHTYPDGTTETNITSITSHVSTFSSIITGCDSLVTTNINVNVIQQSSEASSVCEGENYTYPDGAIDSNITTAISHVSVLSSGLTGCDSLVTTNLAVNPSQQSSESTSICEGENYIYPDGTIDSNITTAISHVSVLSSGLTGCDSLVTTNLAVNPSQQSSESATVCEGENYIYPDGTLDSNIITAISHVSVLSSGLTGCDSLVTTNLAVNPSQQSSESASICEGENYIYPDGAIDSNITNAISHVSVLSSSLTGCDSLVTTNIAVNPSQQSSESASICEGENYTYPDGTTETNITSTTSHVSTFSSTITGCDSLVTTNINVNAIQQSSETSSVCEGENYTYPDGAIDSNITNAIVHVSVLSSGITGCDSLVTTNLAVNPSQQSSESAAICEGENYTYPDGFTETNINMATSHISTLSSVVTGCDSLVTTSITLNTVDIGTTLSGDTIYASAVGANYQWIDCGANSIVSGETGAYFVAGQTGGYAVEVTENGCVDTSACEQITITGISESNPLELNLYPNPGNGTINITLKDAATQDLTVEIKNSLGQIIGITTIPKGSNNYQLQLNQPKGIYFLMIQTSVYKLIIE